MKTIISSSLIIVVLAGCSQVTNTPAPAKSIAVILFDGGDSFSPSPRDSRWVVTNPAKIAELQSYIDNAKPWNPKDPIPQCGAAGCIEVVSLAGNTNRIGIVHIHGTGVSVDIRKSNGQYRVQDGTRFLKCIGTIGVQTNKLFVDHE
jgi:hypothetical protein